MSDVDPKRLASGYVLGFLFFALVLLLWLRGMARFIVPALIIGGLMYFANRVWKKVREPVD